MKQLVSSLRHYLFAFVFAGGDRQGTGARSKSFKAANEDSAAERRRLAIPAETIAVEFDQSAAPFHPISAAALPATFHVGEPLHADMDKQISRGMPYVAAPEKHLLLESSSHISKETSLPRPSRGYGQFLIVWSQVHNLILDYQNTSTHLFIMAYKTRQRDAIWDTIKEAAMPLTAHTICQRAAEKVAGLGIATVYRTLKQLVEEGQARHIEIAGAAPHYESAAKHHHHFFLCEQCKQIFDVDGCLRGIPNLLPEGYRMKRHEIVIYGDCAECLA